jgi:putative chitinase
MISIDELKAATGSNELDALKYIAPLNQSMDRFEINTPQRIAAFLATISIESARLSAVEENLFYSNPERLASIFKRVFPDAKAAEGFTKNPKALSQILYNGFHGRGLIQITHEPNYKACGDALGVNFIEEPELLATPIYAALSAGWFWKTNGCNEAADAGDMDKVTRIVNGPAKLHLAERKHQYDVALAQFA